MEWILSILIFIHEMVKNIWVLIFPQNPAKIKDKYYNKGNRKLGKYREIKTKYDKDLFNASTGRKLRTLAGRYKFRADINWGKSIAKRYRSAWYLVLSAEASSLADDFNDSGSFYHYAAHGFRELGEYELAGKFYKLSSECYLNANDKELALRSCLRGIASYKTVFEDDKANELVELMEKIRQEG